jgi:pimeloyl-ACP methyl ester carboxylesterase
VVVRQGEDDRFVDPGAGRWLASTIPGAIARILPGQGHGSILDPYSEFLGELIEAGDRARGPVTRAG